MTFHLTLPNTAQKKELSAESHSLAEILREIANDYY